MLNKIKNCLCDLKKLLDQIKELLESGQLMVTTQHTYQRCNGDTVIFQLADGEYSEVQVIPQLTLDPSAEEDCQCNCPEKETEGEGKKK